MRRALELAAQARRDGEVPVGAVVVLDGWRSARAGTSRSVPTIRPRTPRSSRSDAAAPADPGNYRLTGATL